MALGCSPFQMDGLGARQATSLRWAPSLETGEASRPLPGKPPLCSEHDLPPQSVLVLVVLPAVVCPHLPRAVCCLHLIYVPHHRPLPGRSGCAEKCSVIIIAPLPPENLRPGGVPLNPQ